MATLAKVSNEIMEGLLKASNVGRKVASDLHSLTLDRIFTEGKNSEGKEIGTYTPFTIRTKKEKGRFTSPKVNLRDTEKLVNSYIFECKGDNCLIGFANVSRGDGTTNAEIKKKLEPQYGDVFNLTSKEESEIQEIIDDYLDNIKF